MGCKPRFPLAARVPQPTRNQLTPAFEESYATEAVSATEEEPASRVVDDALDARETEMGRVGRTPLLQP